MSIGRSGKKSLISTAASLLAIVLVHFVVVSAQDLTVDVSGSEQDKFDKAYKDLEESMNVLGMNSDQFQKTDMAKQLQAALTPVFTVPSSSRWRAMSFF
uniref:Uncharacterized protein n=1 Tax=Ditylenchus dipsaci TaxID=166011 RepID=A0A915DL64_9BILA